MKLAKPILLFVTGGILHRWVMTVSGTLKKSKNHWENINLSSKRLHSSRSPFLLGFLPPSTIIDLLSPQNIVKRRKHIVDNVAQECSSLLVEGQKMEMKATTVGEPGTSDFEVRFLDPKGEVVSPWHYLPVFSKEGLCHMVVEIPRNSRAKMEISTKLEKNPIKQDLLSDGQPRYLDCPLYWNYGAIPQTWESPEPYVYECAGGESLKLIGDGDPLDIVDIGESTASIGDVITVKVVGGLALVDQGEIDWKIFGVSSTDKHFADISDLDDIDKYYPGTTTGIREFFRWYKTPKGKPKNKFLPGKDFIRKEEALSIIKETHDSYKRLVDRSCSAGDLWIHK